MLVTFTTKAYADITMFGDVPFAMLKMVPGAIVAEAVPAALSLITASIEAEKAFEPAEDKDADEPVNNDKVRACIFEIPHQQMLAGFLPDTASKEKT